MRYIIMFLIASVFITSCSYNRAENNSHQRDASTPVFSANTFINPPAYNPIDYPYPIPQSTPNRGHQSDVFSDSTDNSENNTPSLTPQATITSIATSTPEIYERIPTTSPHVLSSFSEEVRQSLTQSTWYQERIHKDVIFHAVSIRGDPAVAQPLVVVFWIQIRIAKDGQRTLMFSPAIASVLISDGSVYHEQWNTEKWSVQNGLESPLLTSESYTGWYQKRFQVRDITGDGKQEIILSGCGGFGNQCYYSLGVWSLNGDELFSATANVEGATISKRNGLIIKRMGIDYYQYSSVEMRPKQIRLDYYMWDGFSFILSNTELQPFTNWSEPRTENL